MPSRSASRSWTPTSARSSSGGSGEYIFIFALAISLKSCFVYRDSPARDALATLLAVFEPREIVTSRTRVGEGSLSAPTLAALRRRSADLPEGCAFRFVERGGAAAPSFNAEDTLAALAHFDAVVYPWAVHEDGNVECYQPDLLPEALRDASDAAFEVSIFLFSCGQSD